MEASAHWGGQVPYNYGDDNGEPMKVREALAMINQILDESLQYNSLVGSWPEIRQLASSEVPAEQTELL